MGEASTPFDGFDVSRFWNTESGQEEERYVDDPLTDLKVAMVERKLKVKLPAAYVALMKTQNGGIPVKTNHRTKERIVGGGSRRDHGYLLDW